tara:strand:- start:3104 stop:3709 length:606 start_codon:yes stop_codon:yes gene_type:complete
MILDPLRRPDDWIDPREHPAHPDYSKVPHYFAADDLEHWWDVKNGVIRTNDDAISMSFHSFYDRDYAGHSYAKLHFDSSFVTITQDAGSPERVMFAPDFADRTDDGALIWHVDHIFGEFELPDTERYPWVTSANLLPTALVSGMKGFENLQQQEKFIHLVTTLLSRHDGVPGKAAVGTEARGKVVFGDELKRLLRSGQLII